MHTQPAVVLPPRDTDSTWELGVSCRTVALEPSSGLACPHPFPQPGEAKEGGAVWERLAYWWLGSQVHWQMAIPFRELGPFNRLYGTMAN